LLFYDERIKSHQEEIRFLKIRAGPINNRQYL